MKLDSIIPIDQAQVAEVGTRRLGRHQLHGSWRASIGIANFQTTLNGAPTVQPRDLAPVGPSAEPEVRGYGAAGHIADHGNWGEQDDGRGLRTAVPVSIRLAIDPTLAPEGDA